MVLSYVIDTLIQVYECLLSCSCFVLNYNVYSSYNAAWNPLSIIFRFLNCKLFSSISNIWMSYWNSL